jgi:subtilase family serine protease
MQNGDSAQATYRLSTLTVTPPPSPAPPQQPEPPPPPPPPVSGAAPDLVISNMTSNTFTVKNQGEVAAGLFRVTMVAGPNHADVDLPGLGVGQSQMRTFDVATCEYVREARADSLNQVAENNEVNNIASHPGPDFC